MNTVTVNASKTYQIHIGDNLLPHIGEYLSTISGVKRVLVLSDSNVWPLYGEVISQSLKNSNYTISHFVIPAGETSKSIENYTAILNHLVKEQFTREDCVVALGGGVVGDLAGFVAATYQRGIAFVQIPTTLLAMVDSSVGGKTAIDLPAGKNLVGTFYQPDLVLCDLKALQTLPADILIDGCAEVIKYGVLFDRNLFEHLDNFGLEFDRVFVIKRCIELKRDIIVQDEKDHGIRKLLNLGHTIGHSIEANSNFTVSHGKAVAIGLHLIAACAASADFCDKETYHRIWRILHRFGLPTGTHYSANMLTAAIFLDKKMGSSDLISLILPQKIGQCIVHPYPIDALKSFIEAGLNYATEHSTR